MNPKPFSTLSGQQPVDKGKLVRAAKNARMVRVPTQCPLLVAYLEQMQLIPGGTFQMGRDDGKVVETPLHQVTLSDFWMGRTLVSQEIWREYRGNSDMPKAPRWGWQARHPIVNVSWYDVFGFCRWVSDVSGVEFTLPTEAQWEYAARGGGKDVKYPWGDMFDGSKLVYEGNSRKRTAPVDRSDRVYVVKFSNGSELLDMAGNSDQWCSDWYANYRSTAVTDPAGPSSPIQGRFKVLRGGSWDGGEGACAERNCIPANQQGYGFRLCCKT